LLMNLSSFLLYYFTAISEALDYDTNLKAVSKLICLFLCFCPRPLKAAFQKQSQLV